MKKYKETKNGGYEIDGLFISKNNKGEITKINQEIKNGKAEIIPYEQPIEELYAQCKKAREDYRLNNFQYNGFNISADRASQADLTSVAVLYQVGLKSENEVTHWKVSTGNYYDISSKSECLDMAGAMSKFVQKCFDTEATVNQEIENNLDVDIPARFDELMKQ